MSQKNDKIMLTQDLIEEVFKALPSEFVFEDFYKETIRDPDFLSRVTFFFSSKIKKKEITYRINLLNDKGEIIGTYTRLDDIPKEFTPKGFFKKKKVVKSRNIQVVYSKTGIE